MTPQPVLGGQPGRRRDVVLGDRVIGIVLEVPIVERSGSFHDYEITGALSTREVAHSGRGQPSAPAVTTPTMALCR